MSKRSEKIKAVLQGQLSKIVKVAFFSDFIHVGYIKSRFVSNHTTYSSNIKCQKYAGMSLNGYIFKKINQN